MSWWSLPAMAVRTYAASATVRAMGPVVSWRMRTGITMNRDVRPTVGLIPTRLLYWLGLMMLPLVCLFDADENVDRL